MLFPGIGPERQDLWRAGLGRSRGGSGDTDTARGDAVKFVLMQISAKLGNDPLLKHESPDSSCQKRASRGPRIPPGRTTEYPAPAFNNRRRLTRCRNVCTEQSAGESGLFFIWPSFAHQTRHVEPLFSLPLPSLNFLANPARWRRTELSGEASIKYSLILITLDYFGLLLLFFHRTQEHNHSSMQGKRCM
jgi:hypothetical protein